MAELDIEQPTHYLLNKQELEVIYNLLKHQYISYENTLALETVRKIGDWLNACQAGSTK